MAIYIITNQRTGLLKIGHASNPLKRLSALQCGSGDRLQLEKMFEGGKAEEKQLHREFKSNRVSGEWFSISVEVFVSRSGLLEIPISPKERKIPRTAAERKAASRKKLQGKAVELPSDVWAALLAIKEREGHRTIIEALSKLVKTELGSKKSLPP